MKAAASMPLSQVELRIIGHWAADCAERALPVFESLAPSDRRPRDAIEGCRAFARGGERTAQLRSLAWAAYAAARAVAAPAAAAAARAAGVAAGLAYMHPLADPDQAKHLLGPAAYAALARELEEGGESGIADAEVRWAIEHAPPEASGVLGRIPERGVGRGRLDALLYQLDAGLRQRAKSP
jgi:hypothetical protein